MLVKDKNGNPREAGVGFKPQGNDGTGNIEERDDWQTPQWLFDLLDEHFPFSYDCCASWKNAKCENFTTDFLNRKQKILGISWMNPPFSRAEEMFKQFFKITERGIAIYRCDNLETKIWQNTILKNAHWILIPNKRICYEGKVGKGARFPSALIGFNVEAPENIEGTTLIIKESSQ